MKEPKEKPSIDLRFPKGSKVQPKGFDGLGVDQKVTVIIKGTVKRVEDSASEWDPGKSCRVHIDACQILGKEKKVSITDAIEASKRKV